MEDTEEQVIIDWMSKFKARQDKALEDYSEGKITMERLAELLNVNFFSLHHAFTKYYVDMLND